MSWQIGAIGLSLKSLIGQYKTAMSYGAVETSEQDARDAEALSSFQESDMLYVKDRQLTTVERLSKCMAVLLPILVGLLIVSFFASFSLRAVRPVSSHDRVPIHSTSSEDSFTSPEVTSSAHRGPPIGKPTFATVSPKASEVSPPVSSSSSSSSSGSSSSSSCSANKACAKLVLTGHCCPTSAGKRFGVSMIASLLLINPLTLVFYEGIMLGCCN